MTADPQYHLFAPDSFSGRVAARQRQKMFEAFLSATGIQPQHTVIDLGPTSDRSWSASNFFEHIYPHKAQITACGKEDARFLEEVYPGVKFVQADALKLPFADRAFDFVHSNAVIEHVGSHARQTAFLREARRVARKGIFITTPNRWFPIEMHTVTPVAHWLPKPVFRCLCRARRLHFFASEENLNLLSAAQLKRLAVEAGLAQIKVSSVTVAAWPSNLLLSARAN